MTAVTATPALTERSPVWELATRECRWFATRASIWIGLVASIGFAVTPVADWDSGSYTEKLAVTFPLGLAAFATALRSASRDKVAQDRMFEPAAPVAAADRTLARAGALVVPVVLAAAFAVGLAIVSRIEGGYWIGEGPRRTDSAQHPVVLLAQIPLAVFVYGAIGLLMGAVVPRRFVATAGLVAGTVLLFGSLAWWAWNTPPVHAVALYQVQPLDVDLPDVRSYADTPEDWLVATPGLYDSHWQRRIVHEPTIIAHDVYLAGLGVALCAFAVGGRRAYWTAGTAVAVAAVAVVVQLAVFPGW